MNKEGDTRIHCVIIRPTWEMLKSARRGRDDYIRQEKNDAALMPLTTSIVGVGLVSLPLGPYNPGFRQE